MVSTFHPSQQLYRVDIYSHGHSWKLYLCIMLLFITVNRGSHCHTNWTGIRRRSDYITGFIAPAIGPNKSKKLTPLIAPPHNIRGKVWMKNNVNGSTDDKVSVCEAMYVIFHSNFAVYIVCQRKKPCEFLWFVWTDCRGNKSYYVITSSANSSWPHTWCVLPAHIGQCKLVSYDYFSREIIVYYLYYLLRYSNLTNHAHLSSR